MSNGHSFCFQTKVTDSVEKGAEHAGDDSRSEGDLMKLEGKTALVAGGGRGIGRAISLALAREGAEVAVADILKENAEEVSREIMASGIKALAWQLDLTKGTEVEQMVQGVLARFGKIDILINCAGWDRLEPFVESNEETCWNQ
jgi:2-hydroxycyclohexanecarboxyl-CoA dehydrogenase